MKFFYNEKENALLDAAMELFIRYGYDKTTVNEIAKNAGISKGAVYLLFDSKQAIMENLLFRESKRYNLRWFALTDTDPQGGLLSGMYKNLLIALSASPMMTALFKSDRQILGSFLKLTPIKSYGGLIREDFIKRLQYAGAVRKDMDPAVTAHIMDMIAYALFSMGEIKPTDKTPDMDKVFDIIAKMMDSCFTPEDGGNSEAGKKVLHQIKEEALAYYKKQGVGQDDSQ